MHKHLLKSKTKQLAAMIKIFRHIRQKLLWKGKTVSYVKYAIGEIVLVVIGILIALQINNANEKKREELKVHSLMHNMIQDLAQDTLSLTTFVALYDIQANNCKKLLSDATYTNMATDSLFLMLPLNQAPLVVNSATLDKIKNASIANYLPELEDAINNYYTLQTEFFKAQIDWESTYTSKDENFWFTSLQMEIPNIISIVEDDIPYTMSEAERKQEITRVLTSLEGRKRIRMALHRKQMMMLVMDIRKKEATKLIALIKEYLNPST